MRAVVEHHLYDLLYCTVLYCTVLYCTALYCTCMICSSLSTLLLAITQLNNPGYGGDKSVTEERGEA